MRQCVMCSGWMRPISDEVLRCDLCGEEEPNDLPKPDPRRTRCEGLDRQGCNEKFETFVTKIGVPRGWHLGANCYRRMVERDAREEA